MSCIIQIKGNCYTITATTTHKQFHDMLRRDNPTYTADVELGLGVAGQAVSTSVELKLLAISPVLLSKSIVLSGQKYIGYVRKSGGNIIM